MERVCQSYGCFEIAKEGRRLCVMHYNQSQAEYNRRRRAKVCTNVNDEYRAQVEGADKIWKSVLANEETVKRQEEGLRRIGYERPKKESGFIDEIKRILKEFVLRRLYAWTGISPLEKVPTQSTIGYNATTNNIQPIEIQPDPFASLEFMQPERNQDTSSADVNMPITDIDEVYKGCLGGRNNVSLCILGGSGQGKSYTARYLIEALHRRNNYKHFLMIMKM